MRGPNYRHLGWLASSLGWMIIASCSDAGDGGTGQTSAGSAGEPGTSGRAGEVGTSGTAGEVGTSGTAGKLGASGAAGELGASGTAGDNASSGGTGAVGGRSCNTAAGEGGDGFGEAASGGESGASGASGASGSDGKHCVPLSAGYCATTAADCTLGFRCSEGRCVPGPVAGEPGVGPSGDECAHGYYATSETNHVCAARAPIETLGCIEEGDPPQGRPYCEEELRCLLILTSVFRRCQMPRSSGGICMSNSHCEAGLGCASMTSTGLSRCWSLSIVGGPCNNAPFPLACPAGSQCVGTDPQSQCVAYPGAGEACDEGRCGPGLLCDSNVCVVPPALGQPCGALGCGAGLACVAAGQ